MFKLSSFFRRTAAPAAAADPSAADPSAADPSAANEDDDLSESGVVKRALRAYHESCGKHYEHSVKEALFHYEDDGTDRTDLSLIHI